jgi:hypothetical protein
MEILETKRIEPSTRKRGEHILHFDQTKISMSTVVAQPGQVGKHTLARSPRAEGPC